MAAVLDVRRTPDGIFLACDGEAVLATAYEVETEPGWWRAYLPNGTSRRMYEPHRGGEKEETRAAESVLRRRLAR
ncbi:hypothetical protein [Actinomadura nitritigenes]|uniref:hypothetical protein n=1 Tax=Actinomadura nitritigenes TaxID=134602 RepID=UPI003D8F4746